MRRGVFPVIVAIFLVGAPISAQRKTTEAPTIALNGTLDEPTAAPDATVWPALGDAVTFSVTYPKSVERFGPRVSVSCYQGENLVYMETGPWSQAFVLGGGSSEWWSSPGPAHCIADLYYWSYNGGQKFNWLASTEFNAPTAQ